jgi:N-acetylglutamate synthase-like GNAT family acetyltransferase
MIQSFERAQTGEVLRLLQSAMNREMWTKELFIEKTFDDPDYDPSLILIYKEVNEIVGFCQGVIRQRSTGLVGYIKVLGVAESYRRKGIAGELLKMIETGMNNKGVNLIRLLESYPNYLSPGIDPFYTEAVCFFERKGYKKFNDTSNLSVDLRSSSFATDREEKEISMKGFQFRQAEQTDRVELLEWIKKYFVEWRGEILNVFATDVPTVHIALRNKKICAFSAYEGNNRGTGWFGPIGTQPDQRGYGIGAILLKRCLASLAEMGFEKAIIPFVGPIPFYSYYANAKVERVFWRYEKYFEGKE